MGKRGGEMGCDHWHYVVLILSCPLDFAHNSKREQNKAQKEPQLVNQPTLPLPLSLSLLGCPASVNKIEISINHGHEQTWTWTWLTRSFNGTCFAPRSTRKGAIRSKAVWVNKNKAWACARGGTLGSKQKTEPMFTDPSLWKFDYCVKRWKRPKSTASSPIPNPEMSVGLLFYSMPVDIYYSRETFDNNLRAMLTIISISSASFFSTGHAPHASIYPPVGSLHRQYTYLGLTQRALIICIGGFFLLVNKSISPHWLR